MKKFRYRLERVLEYRKLIKAEKLRDLTLRNQEMHEAKSHLEYLEAELIRELGAHKGVMTIEELTLQGSYRDRIRNLIAHQHEVIEELRVKVEEALAAYIEAAKDAESLEKHKTNKREEYQSYIDKETQKFLDELATQRSGRAKNITKSSSKDESSEPLSESESTKELV